MQISDEMVEKAVRELANIDGNDFDSNLMSDHDRGLYRKRAARVLTAALAGHVVVPKAALAWLFGEAPDAEGKWFGDCEDDVKPIAGKYKRTYWWRSKFRAMIRASQHGGDDAGK